MPSIVGGMSRGGKRVRISSVKKRKRKPSFTESYDQNERRDALGRLGFTTYAAYLRSSLWASIRSLVEQRSEGICETPGCSAPMVSVHHTAYNIATLSGKRLESLKAVCKSCHIRGHKDGAPTVPQLIAQHKCETCDKAARRDGRFCKACRRKRNMDKAR